MVLGRSSFDAFQRPSLKWLETGEPSRTRASFDVRSRPDTIDLQLPRDPERSRSNFRGLALPLISVIKRPSSAGLPKVKTASPKTPIFAGTEDGSRKSFSNYRTDRDSDIFGCCGDIDDNEIDDILADLPSFYTKKPSPLQAETAKLDAAQVEDVAAIPVAARSRRARTCNDLIESTSPPMSSARARAISDIVTRKHIVPMHPLRKTTSPPFIAGSTIATPSVQSAPQERKSKQACPLPKQVLKEDRREIVPSPPTPRQSLDTARDKDYATLSTTTPSRSSLDSPRRIFAEARNTRSSRSSLDSPRHPSHLLTSPVLPCVAEEVAPLSPRDLAIAALYAKKPKHTTRRRVSPEESEKLDRWRRQVTTDLDCSEESNVSSDERAGRAGAIIAAAKARSDTLSAKQILRAPTGPLPELPRQDSGVVEGKMQPAHSSEATPRPSTERLAEKSMAVEPISKLGQASAKAGPNAIDIDAVLCRVFDDLAVAEEVFRHGSQTLSKRRSLESTSTVASTPHLSEDYDFSLSSQRSSATFANGFELTSTAARPSSGLTEKCVSMVEKPPTRYGTPLSMYGDVTPEALHIPGALPFHTQEGDVDISFVSKTLAPLSEKLYGVEDALKSTVKGKADSSPFRLRLLGLPI